MPDESQTAVGLSDADFIELLWKCAYWGGELMPPTMPRSALLLEWAEWQEQATEERQRREALSSK